jgi:Gpi18-like mannosyltransferase
MNEVLQQASTFTSIGTRWRWAIYPTVLFFCVRVALMGVSQLGMTVVTKLYWDLIPRDFLQQYPALDGLCRWDCFRFEEIARRGYFERVAVNFFPLYPLTARVLHDLTGLEMHLALLLISNIASFGSYLLIYHLFIMLANEDAARWGLALFAAYPFAFFQATGYPESLMIFTSSLAILLALKGHHVWAGTVLGFGVLARHLTMFAGAALLIAQVRQRGLRPRAFLLSFSILGLIIPWLFLAVYSMFQYYTFGDPFTFWRVRSEWGSLAWWGIITLIRPPEWNEHVPIMYSYVPFALLVTVGALALLTRKQWYELASFTLLLLVMLWFTGVWGLGRYSASCWPAFLPLGVWLSKRPLWQSPAIAFLAIFQGLFFFVFSHGYPIL